jgi:hypothetical protein
MREDTFEKRRQMEELQKERDDIKAQIQKVKAELKHRDKELAVVTLEAAREAIKARQAELETNIEELEDKLMTLKEGVKEAWKGDGFALVLQEVYCGDNCKGCPHGPYWRVIWREGRKVVVKHIAPMVDKRTGAKVTKEEAWENAYRLRWSGHQ